jgi:hypothetical protein
MNRSLAVAVLLFGASLGCAGGRSPMPAPPVTALRLTLIDSAQAILEKALHCEGWDAQVTATSKIGQTAVNSDEAWDENTAWVTFTAQRSAGGPTLLTPEESAAVLKAVRSDLRRLIQAFGGEVLDTSEGEAYREKWVAVTYRLDKTIGTIRVKIGPASGRPEETDNRLEVVVREQAK